MDVLPPGQQRLWPLLQPALNLGFTLYGGTAIALRLGHRQSVDFDFFSDQPLDRQAIGAAMPFVLQATKLKVVLQRAEAKDYRDVASMLNAGVDLPRGLASARVLFGPNFQPSESLKALVFFKDGDLNTLSVSEKNTLIEAVKQVRDLPEVSLRSTRLM